MNENLTPYPVYPEKFNPETDVSPVSKLYAEVFAAPPWNEVWRCESCDRFYGPQYSGRDSSPCCSKPLIMAYPEEETTDYINKESSKPEAQIKLFCTGKRQLVAFAWGYQIDNTEKLAKEKWPQSEEVQANVVQAITSVTDPNLPIYYISEVGVSDPFRGNGIGYELTKDLLNYGFSLQNPVVFRTNWNSPMMLIARRLGMQQIMGPEIMVENGQIINTGNLINFQDIINSDRTLFIKLL